jgi:hypothetical protein
MGNEVVRHQGLQKWEIPMSASLVRVEGDSGTVRYYLRQDGVSMYLAEDVFKFLLRLRNYYRVGKDRTDSKIRRLKARLKKAHKNKSTNLELSRREQEIAKLVKDQRQDAWMDRRGR